jgi:nickel superoxide dismutase
MKRVQPRKGDMSEYLLPKINLNPYKSGFRGIAMIIRILILSGLCFLVNAVQGNAHCQMPCGIYHDDMVYDQIDQFVETVYKAIAIMNQNKNATPKDRNEFVRWVIQKEKSCNETAELISYYFLQQKIKPGEPDTEKRLIAAHKLLFGLVAIKQNSDLEFVKSFNNDWEEFKLMFHREGYECEMEKKEFDTLEELRKKQEAKETKTKETDRKNKPRS